MKLTTTLLAVCLCFAAVHSLPAPGFQSRVLDRLMARENPQDDSALRNKRTIGLLRQLFPDITKMIEDKVNMVIGEVLKIFGPAVIQSVLGNNNKNQASKNSADGSTVQAKNPFGDDDDNDNTFSFTDDDDFFNKPASPSQSGSSSGSSSVTSSSGDGSSKISLQLPTVKTEDDRDKTTPVDSSTKSAAATEDEDVMTVTPVTAESAPPAIFRI